MDVLDKPNKHDFYIVMDNCRTRHYQYVVDVTDSRGYKPLFMPPYSPFLNPIEEYWSKIKKHVKRNSLLLDTLTFRIKAACETVTTDDCLDWIRHSKTYWDRYLNRQTSIV
ncbi:hypothetical protein RMATCC62417_14677 [Rhizopus microsporus]|nr:hypothetical protein RMATCC62417_14677 [Rhizopus microsporus]